MKSCMSNMVDKARGIGRRFGRMLVQIHRRVPPGLRTILGLALIAGGFVGFLPILGFWMIPLGIAVVGLDVAPLWRAWKARAERHRRNRSSDLR